jgi:hypothetical protein
MPTADTHSMVVRSSTVTVTSGRAARLRAFRVADEVATRKWPSSNR